MVLLYSFSSEKNQLEVEKKLKISFFGNFICSKMQSEKTFDVTFSLKRNLQKLRTINETMNLIIGLSHEI